MNDEQSLTAEVTASPLAADAAGFDLAQRQARALAASDLVPQQYRGQAGMANCLLAMELAHRAGMSPLMVMQNLHVIQGSPSWSSAFIIAQVNASGRFTPLRFEMDGEGDEMSCRAVANDMTTGQRIEGPVVTIGMAKAAGWHGKPGSKWRTMPELMLRYRAGAFFGRTVCPDLLLGLQSADELRDITVDPATGEVQTVKGRGMAGLREAIMGGQDNG